MALETCDTCYGTGLVYYTCGEGTCDMSEWCECPAGVEGERVMEEERRKWRLNRMADAGVFDCMCADCRWARNE